MKDPSRHSPISILKSDSLWLKSAPFLNYKCGASGLPLMVCVQGSRMDLVEYCSQQYQSIVSDKHWAQDDMLAQG
jgi:hypothetical protein